MAAVLLTAAPLAVPAALAAGQATTPAGSAFTSACADISILDTGRAGDALNGGSSSPPGVLCQGGTGTLAQPSVAASTSNSGTQNGHAFADSASSTIGSASIKLQAHNTGSTGSASPAGMVNGGWHDNYTLTKAGQSGQGVWIIPVHVDGTVNTSGIGGEALLSVEDYLNHNMITASGPPVNGAAYGKYLALNPGNCVYACGPGHYGATVTSWSYENFAWTALDRSDSLNDPGITVSQDVFLAVPFIWGTQFELGIYAHAVAGTAYNGAPVNDTTADVAFQNTITWGGPGCVLDFNGSSLSGAHVTGFEITSASHANYAELPEPGSLAVLAAAVAGLAVAGRRRRRGDRRRYV